MEINTELACVLARYQEYECRARFISASIIVSDFAVDYVRVDNTMCISCKMLTPLVLNLSIENIGRANAEAVAIKNTHQ